MEHLDAVYTVKSVWWSDAVKGCSMYVQWRDAIWTYGALRNDISVFWPDFQWYPTHNPIPEMKVIICHVLVVLESALLVLPPDDCSGASWWGSSTVPDFEEVWVDLFSDEGLMIRAFGEEEGWNELQIKWISTQGNPYMHKSIHTLTVLVWGGCNRLLYDEEFGLNTESKSS